MFSATLFQFSLWNTWLVITQYLSLLSFLDVPFIFFLYLKSGSFLLLVQPFQGMLVFFPHPSESLALELVYGTLYFVLWLLY